MSKRMSAVEIVAIAGIGAFVGSLVANLLFIALGLTSRMKLDAVALAIYAGSVLIHAAAFFLIVLVSLVLLRKIVPSDRIGGRFSLFVLLGIGAVSFVSLSALGDLWWLAFAFGPATVATVLAVFLMLKRSVREPPNSSAV